MSARWFGLLLLACAAAPAADREFDSVVKAIETQYGTRRTHVPLMGAANFFIKVARPAGTSSFRLAIFEHLEAGSANRDEFMDHLATGSLHPMVRVHSRRDGEATYILAGDAGKSTRLLIAVFERNEATVIEIKVNPEALRRTIDHPESFANSFLGKHDDR